MGEAEKLVRTLFLVAISRQPSVIFMDEVWWFFFKHVFVSYIPFHWFHVFFCLIVWHNISVLAFILGKIDAWIILYVPLRGWVLHLVTKIFKLKSTFKREKMGPIKYDLVKQVGLCLKNPSVKHFLLDILIVSWSLSVTKYCT